MIIKNTSIGGKILFHQQKDAVTYFQQKGFQRLFKLFIKKYQGLGRLSGSVTLNNLTLNEQETLSSFFRKDYYNQKSATISFALFKKSLASTRFSSIDIKEFLNDYAGKDLLTKAEEIQIFESNKENFFSELDKKFSNVYCKSWISHIKNKGAGSHGIHKAYNSNPELLKIHLEHIFTAITALTEDNQSGNRTTRFIRLPIFANQITSDPHGFDYDTEQGRFFVSALQFIRQNRNAAHEYQTKLYSEQITELLQNFGIVRDDILNFVTCAGILSFSKDNEKPLPIWKSAWEENNVLNVPLREMAHLNKSMVSYIYENPVAPNIVFVVENSGVFSTILDQFEGTKLPPIICTHGQFKLASLILMDLLVKNNTMIYYSGDFDPEGLQMAQRLKQRYPNHVKLWHYQTEDYIKSLSNVELLKNRLNLLQSVKIEELVPIKKLMLQKKRAGYQEEMINLLVEDMKRIAREHKRSI